MKIVTMTTPDAATPAMSIAQFMHQPIKNLSPHNPHEVTPAQLLRDPGEDIGLADIADEWTEMIIASDDPGMEFEMLINHLSGVLGNVELMQKHYRLQFGHAA